MDVRNVQKTGNMFYLYLPTSWCRKYKIDGKSRVGVSMNTDGTLSVHPQISPRKAKSLTLKLAEDDQNILNKLIVSCYINPASAFKINLASEMDSARLLDQKKLLNVELVEYDGTNITCESTISVSDPESLLKTMITKVKNLVSIMLNHYNMELIGRYEEEIDRSKLLIEKATLSRLTFQETTTLKAIDLHYIALLAKSLERLTDHLRLLPEKSKDFITKILKIINALKKLSDQALASELDIPQVINVVKMMHDLNVPKIKDEQTHHKQIVVDTLENILEVMMDWSLTQELDLN